MTSISLYLHDDHARCDASLDLAEAAVAGGDWLAARRQFDEFEQALLRHLRREEEVLFPAFERATGSFAGPTVVMRMEHRQLRATLAPLREALIAGDADAFGGGVDTLRILIGQHNLKEEGILYPMTDHALAEIAQELVGEMEAVPAVALEAAA